MSVIEIKSAIKRLTPEEVDELTTWLVSYYSEVWDDEIEKDLREGRLDPVIAEVENEIG